MNKSVDQLSIFKNYENTAEPNKLELYIDGASRHNPGEAGAGILLLKNGEPVIKKGFYLGCKTNNQAEYLSLLIGLFLLEKYTQKGDELKIFSDSKLLVEQVSGRYKVKSENLIPLCRKIKKVLFKLNCSLDCTIIHVLREYNKVADKLANDGIDQKTRVPEDFEYFLQEL